MLSLKEKEILVALIEEELGVFTPEADTEPVVASYKSQLIQILGKIKNAAETPLHNRALQGICS